MKKAAKPRRRTGKPRLSRIPLKPHPEFQKMVAEVRGRLRDESEQEAEEHDQIAVAIEDELRYIVG
jgi:hypothetical protein